MKRLGSTGVLRSDQRFEDVSSILKNGDFRFVVLVLGGYNPNYLFYK